jgi:hypothetical protein
MCEVFAKHFVKNVPKKCLVSEVRTEYLSTFNGGYEQILYRRHFILKLLAINFAASDWWFQIPTGARTAVCVSSTSVVMCGYKTLRQDDPSSKQSYAMFTKIIQKTEVFKTA